MGDDYKEVHRDQRKQREPNESDHFHRGSIGAAGALADQRLSVLRDRKGRGGWIPRCGNWGRNRRAIGDQHLLTTVGTRNRLSSQLWIICDFTLAMRALETHGTPVHRKGSPPTPGLACDRQQRKQATESVVFD